MSSFREEAARQKHVVGIHNDLATLFAELSQNLAGAPSNALLAGLLQQAAPRGVKTDVWARLRGQQGQLSLKVDFCMILMQQLGWCRLFMSFCCSHVEII